MPTVHGEEKGDKPRVVEKVRGRTETEEVSAAGKVERGGAEEESRRNKCVRKREQKKKSKSKTKEKIQKS